jgi:hypothetical protein
MLEMLSPRPWSKVVGLCSRTAISVYHIWPS